MKKKQVTFEETTNNIVVDSTTGEISQTQTKNTKRVKVECEPDYIKLYLFGNTMLNFQKAIRGVKERDAVVLYEILKRMTYDNTITLDGERMSEIASVVNVSTRTIERLKKTFIEIGVFLHYTLPDGSNSKKTYYVNPNLFGRGKWEDIKRLRAEFVYNEKGVTYKFERVQKGRRDGEKEYTTEYEAIV